MRTRSQPASPGGFVSLETEQTTTRRVTRSTRAASRAASQEPSSQQAIEPSTSTQPATRPKSQRKIKKPVTRKTAATTTSTTTSTAPSTTASITTSTTSTTKPQARKAPKRGTRKTTRKTQQATSDETDSNAETIIESTQKNEDRATNDIEIRASDSQDMALMEPRSSVLNRKRSHSQASPEDDAAPSTPSTKRRRNLGPPGSTPFSRTALSRRLPDMPVSRSERLLRRQAEREGRIHTTIFRLPEYVAQTEADRLAAQSSAPANPSFEPLQVNPEFSREEPQNNGQVSTEQPATVQEPSTPESANSRWNIRGLLNSVPRSFSRFLPSFARTPERPGASVPQQPSSERIQRTQPTEVVLANTSEREPQSRRRLSEQLPAQRQRNLSYSLFPTPIDRSLYLGDIPKPTTDAASSAPATAQVDERGHKMPERSEPQDSATPSVHERGRDATPQATPVATHSQKKKRKRAPSPDVIPNPVGSSYGMDLDYFYYSSESEDEDTETPVPQTELRNDTLAKTALRGNAQSERPASKKVRFDASPENTPSRLRARATDPYTGVHFIGMGNPQSSSASTDSTTPTPATPTPVQRIVDPTQRPGFIPNISGTFQLDYDAFSDDSDSSSAPSPPGTPAPTSVIQTPTSTQPTTLENTQLQTPRTASRAVQPLPTPAKIDEEALARARSQAEKYKPKTPSGLRTASRYSSPLTAPTPDATPAPATKTISEQFGDDQYAQDAQWLYEHCPSGDLSQLVWPQPTSLAETLGIDDEAVRIMNDIWDESQVDEYHSIFQQGAEELRQTLAL
ncbi:hypothetical protein BJY00DRAFT_278135 [Aspergillus carlsbadensis]|nr:hypothetical protein BJY00DRAFT_278135 [Aspergillus carlsbadensis]